MLGWVRKNPKLATAGLYLHLAWAAQTQGQNSWEPIAGRFHTVEEALQLVASNVGWVRSQASFFAQMQAVLHGQLMLILAKDEEREDAISAGYKKPDMSAADYLGEDIDKVDPAVVALADGLGKNKSASVSPALLKDDPSVTLEERLRAQAVWAYAIELRDKMYTVNK